MTTNLFVEYVSTFYFVECVWILTMSGVFIPLVGMS